MNNFVSLIIQIISAVGGGLGIFAYFKIYRTTLKIVNRPPSIKSSCKAQYAIWQFIIANVGLRSVVVAEVYYLLNNSPSRYKLKSTNTNIKAFPVKLNDSESFACFFTYGDNTHVIDELQAEKLQLIVIDINGKEYRTKWLNIETIPAANNSLCESELNKDMHYNAIMNEK